MSAIAASPDMPMATPAVAHSSSHNVGFYGLAKGSVYYPTQVMLGVAALTVIKMATLSFPTPDELYKVFAVRSFGVAANASSGPLINVGVKMDKTPSENLYGFNLLSYGIQRTTYSASAAVWPIAFAIGLTIVMPYIAPIFVAAASGLTAAGAALSGGLATAAASHSGILAVGSQMAGGTLTLLGNFASALPAAFAMKEGVSFVAMAMANVQRIFMINLLGGVAGDILCLEKINPFHKILKSRMNDATKAETPTR